MIGVYKFRTMYAYSEYLQPYMLEHEGLQDGGKFVRQEDRIEIDLYYSAMVGKGSDHVVGHVPPVACQGAAA